MPVSVSSRSLLKASGLTAAAVSVNGAASAVASAATKDINVQHPIICQNNFRHSFSLTWSGKTCDIRRSL